MSGPKPLRKPAKRKYEHHQDVPVSLAPLTIEQALAALMKIPARDLDDGAEDASVPPAEPPAVTKP
jgi:hypothetical protein